MSEVALSTSVPKSPMFGRTWWALVRKDYLVLANRRSVWAFQTVVLLYFCAVLLMNLLGDGGSLTDLDRLRSAAEGMALTAALTTFAAALLIAPMLTVSALTEESEGGMLEVLQAAPIDHRQLFAAILSARLALVWMMLFACVPFVTFPMILGATIPWNIIMRSLPCIALGTAITMLYSLQCTARGESRLTTYWKLVTLVAFTPGTRGFAAMLRILVAWAALVLLLNLSQEASVIHAGEEFLQGLVFPFVGVLTLISDGWSRPFLSGGGVFALAVGFIVAYGSSRGSFVQWMTRSAHGRTARQVRRKTKPTWERRRRALQRVIGMEEVTPLEEEDDYRRPKQGSLLLSTRELRRLGGVPRMIYDWSGKNPFVAKELLVPSRGAGLMWGLGVFLILFGWGMSTAIFFVGFFGAAAVASVPLSQLFMGSAGGRGEDLLKSTPLSSIRVIAGAIGVVSCRVWLLVLVTSLYGFFTIVDVEPDYVFLCLANFWLALALVVALGLLANLILDTNGQRIAVILGVLLLATVVLQILPRGIAHPIALWELDPLVRGTLDYRPTLYFAGLVVVLVGSFVWGKRMLWRR